MRQRRLLEVGLALVVTVACAIWLLRAIDLAAVATTLSQAHGPTVMVAFALALLLPFWRGARLRHLLPPGCTVPAGALTRIAAEVLLWSFLLPFKLGELTFPWLIHRRLNVPLGEAAGLLLFVRLADLAVVAGLFTIGLGLVGFDRDLLWAAALLIGGGALLAAPAVLALLGGLAYAWLPARPRLLRQAAAGASHARTLRARLWLALTTLGLWGTHAVIAALALRACGVTPDAATALLASSAGNLAFALPVTGVLGLGPQQVAFATAVSETGTAWEVAVSAAITTYVVVVSAALAAGLAARLGRSSATIA